MGHSADEKRARDASEFGIAFEGGAIIASKSAIEAGRGEVRLGVDSTALEKGLAAAQAKFAAWGKGIVALGAGIAAAGAAITAPFLAGMLVFTSWGDEVSSAMRQTGLSFQQTQDIMRGTRTTTEELIPAFAHLSQFVVQAAQGSQEANQALRTMGLNIGDLLGMNPAERFNAIANAIANLGDANQRIAMQRTVLGRGFSGNLEGGAEGMASRRARAEYISGAPTDADRALARETSRAFKEMGQAIEAVWREIGAAAAPVMRDFFNLITVVVVEIRQWVTANRELLTVVFRVVDAMVTIGAVVGGIGTAVYAASYAFAFLRGAVGIVGSAIGALSTMLYYGSGAFLLIKGVAWLASLSVAAGSALASFAMSALSVAVGFAASGFGLFALASWISTAAIFAWKAALWLGWTAITAVTASIAFMTGGWGITTIAAWAYAGAMAVVKLVTWLASAAMGVFAGSAVAAAGATTIATAGINLIVAALGVLVAAIFAIPLVWFGMAAFSHMADGTVRAVAAIGVGLSNLTNNIVGFASRISSSLSVAWAVTSREFSAMASGLVSTAMTAWDGIRDAMAVGDMTAAWRMISLAAQIAWLDIKGFAAPVWVEWKYAAIAVWNEIKDSLVDAFRYSFVTLKQMFVQLWAFIKEGWQNSSASALGDDINSDFHQRRRAALRVNAQIEAAAISDRETGAQTAQALYDRRAELIEEQMRLLRGEAAAATAAAAAVANQNPDLAITPPAVVEPAGGFSPQQLRDIERNERDLRLWISREQERIQGITSADLAGERQGLQDQLNAAALDAQIAAIQRNMQGGMDAIPGGPGDGFIGGGRGMSAPGSFFADAIRGWGGAGGGQSPAQVTNNRLATLIELQEQVLAEMRRIQGLGFA